MMQPRYRLRFFFDYGSGICFWTSNEQARARFGGYPVEAEALPLTQATAELIAELIAWYDRSLDWDHPSYPSPWRREEWDRFNRSVRDLLDTVGQELGDSFEIVNEYVERNEEPDPGRATENRLST